MRLNVDPSTLMLTHGDFAAAFSKVVPASRRSSGTPARALEGLAAPLLEKHVNAAYEKACAVFAPADKDIAASSAALEGGGAMIHAGSEEWIAALTDVQHSIEDSAPAKSCSSLWDPSSITSRPRVMIRGPRGMSHADVAAALLQKLESFQVFSIDLSSLLADGAFVSAEQALVSRMLEARRAAPCVLYLPDIIGWWRAASDSLRTVLTSQLESIPVNLPVLWVSTLIFDKGRAERTQGTDTTCSDGCVGTAPAPACVDLSGGFQNGEVDRESASAEDTIAPEWIDERLVQAITFLGGGEGGWKEAQSGEANCDVLERSFASVVDLSGPTSSERLDFFKEFFDSLSRLPSTLYSAQKSMYTARNQVLSIAEQVSVAAEEGDSRQGGPRLMAAALADINEERDKNYMREQRVFFRAALSELLKEKRFQSLWRPVDPEQVPDYYDVITAPMDLETMRSKVDADLYPTYKYFLYDIEQIVFNAKEYNPLNSKDSRGRSIVSAAHNMLDVVETHTYAFTQRMGYDVFKRCEEVCLRRGMERWRLEPDREHRHVMPEENEIYYAEVLRVHHEVKKELRQSSALPDEGAALAAEVGDSAESVSSSAVKRRLAGREPEMYVDEAVATAAEQLNERELRRLSRERAASEARRKRESAGQCAGADGSADNSQTAGGAAPTGEDSWRWRLSGNCPVIIPVDWLVVAGEESERGDAPTEAAAPPPDFDDSPLSAMLQKAVSAASQVKLTV